MTAFANAFILAGGKGTRIQSLNAAVPKPLIKINGREVLFRQIDLLLQAKIPHITIIAGYMGEVIEAAVQQEYGQKAPSVRVVIEPTPLGTGGCLSMVRAEAMRGANLILSGDLVLEMDFAKLLTFHQIRCSSLTLTVHPNTHPRDSDLVEVGVSDRVIRMLLRPHPADMRYRNLVNASVCVLNPEIWEFIPYQKPFNFEKDLVTAVLDAGRNVLAYNTSEYIRDMGTPDRWYGVSKDLDKGLPAARSLARKQKAIFFDRDGVLNVYKGMITRPEDLILEDGAIEAVKLVNRSAYLAIVVTNQPQVAKGLCSFEQISEIHKQLDTHLGDNAAKLDEIFFCPHHPESGFPGEVAELKIPCKCRKPNPGMLLDAAARFNIDLSQSYMIGDTTQDMVAGSACGTRTVLVSTGLRGEDGKFKCTPDLKAPNVLAAVHAVLADGL